MKARRLISPAAIGLLAMISVSMVAQSGGPFIDWPQPIPVGTVNATTSVVLRQVRLDYQPPPPYLSISVLRGTTLKLSTPFPDSQIISIRWVKDTVTIPVTSKTLVIEQLKEEDAGVYAAAVDLVGGATPPLIGVVEGIRVQVDVPHPQRLLNVSARATISPSNPMLIGGFILAPNVAKTMGGQQVVLIRAVGRSLAKYGVTNPLAKPRVKIFNGAGVEVVPELPFFSYFGHTATTIAPRVGAFSFVPAMDDVALLIYLSPGPYTVQVTSGDGTSGDVLLEVYEVPEEKLQQ